MNYSLQNLTKVADCDVLLALATKEKANLTFKKLSDERMTARFTETAIELEAALQGVLAEISATETIISVLPDGPAKEEAMDKKTRLEYRKFVIETRIEKNGSVALLEKEMDLARVNQEITEVDAFLEAVTNRKQELNA